MSSKLVKTELAGGFIWIEHDDSVGLNSRIYTLHTQAPGHPSFSMGMALARDVATKLLSLTAEPNDEIVRYTFTVNDHQVRQCASCNLTRLAWQAETVGGELITCCTHCQYVIERVPLVRVE